jgi:hypothetical protein
MVDSWRNIPKMEVFRSKFAPMDPRETSVFFALIHSLELMVFTLQREQGRASCGALIVSFFVSSECNQTPSRSSSIIQDIRGMCASGLASVAFFYCDFREDQKKDRRGLLSSLLVQLCDQSDAYYAALSQFYFSHGHGSQHASDSELVQCLKHLLELPDQATAYVIIDALDECPTTTGLPSPREEVLELVKELVGLHIPSLRICVTSRPEADIEPVLGPLAFRSVSLHGECGQAQDIEEYIRFVVNTDPKMRAWRAADKKLVIETLTKKADGM